MEGKKEISPSLTLVTDKPPLLRPALQDVFMAAEASTEYISFLSLSSKGETRLIFGSFGG